MPRKPEISWYQKAASLIAREGIGLAQAVTRLGVDLTTEELGLVQRNAEFQKILWTERHKFYQELAANPERNKLELIGRMMVCAQRLMEEEEWDKAIEALLKIAKVENWVGEEGTVNVFAGLTGEQIAQLREKLAKKNQELPATQGNA